MINTSNLPMLSFEQAFCSQFNGLEFKKDVLTKQPCVLLMLSSHSALKCFSPHRKRWYATYPLTEQILRSILT